MSIPKQPEASTLEILQSYPEAHDAYVYAFENDVSRVPSVDELADYWKSTYDKDADIEPTGEIYGIMRNPGHENPWAVASIDLCDVTRQTTASIMRLGGFTVNHIGEKYFYGSPFGLDADPDAIVRIVQTTMVRDGVAPVEGIEDIRAMLQGARQQGVYVVANTSTLEGCELATIDWLARFLPGCFDGIVLPRNHDGNGSVTKGTAKEAVLAALGTVERPEKIQYTIHIDDAPHHIHAMRKVAEHLNLSGYADFTPLYNWNAQDLLLNHQATPLESFQIADKTLREWDKRTV